MVDKESLSSPGFFFLIVIVSICLKSKETQIFQHCSTPQRHKTAKAKDNIRSLILHLALTNGQQDTTINP